MDYSQITAEFYRLKAQYDAGGLSEADFRARLQDLMVQDEPGMLVDDRLRDRAVVRP